MLYYIILIAFMLFVAYLLRICVCSFISEIRDLRRFKRSFSTLFFLLLHLACIIFLTVFLVVMVQMLVQDIDLALRTESQEYLEVTGIVTKKEYEDSYYTYITTTNGSTTSLAPMYIEASHKVTIAYEGLSATFDNQPLFYTVNKGDPVKVILCNHYDKNNNLIHQSLSLPEE